MDIWITAAVLAGLAVLWGGWSLRHARPYMKNAKYQWTCFLGYGGWSFWLLSWAGEISGLTLSEGADMWGASLLIVPVIAWHMGECWRMEAEMDGEPAKNTQGLILKRVSMALLLLDLIFVFFVEK